MSFRAAGVEAAWIKDDMGERIKISSGRVGMMLTCFLMLTLIGVFATYATPIPGIRGVLVEQALMRAAVGNDPAAMRAALSAAKPLLGVTAAKQLSALRPDPAGLEAASRLVTADTLRASALISYRSRLLVIVIGVLTGLFSIALLGIGEAASPDRTDHDRKGIQP